MMSRLSHLRVSALQNVQRSTFNAQRSTLNVQRSTLNGHLCSQRRSRRHPVKISASPRLCVKKLSTFNAQRSTLNHLRNLCHLWMKPETRNPKPSLCVSALKRSIPLLLAALCASAARDPFWPIGYEPPKPEPEMAEPEKPAMPEPPPPPKKPAPPPPAPITEDDWKAARALLAVSGFTQSKNPASGETRTLAMINRASFTVGDTLTVTNANIHFVWRIESLAGLALKLKPVRAERLTPPPLPAN